MVDLNESMANRWINARDKGGSNGQRAEGLGLAVGWQRSVMSIVAFLVLVWVAHAANSVHCWKCKDSGAAGEQGVEMSVWISAAYWRTDPSECGEGGNRVNAHCIPHVVFSAALSIVPCVFAFFSRVMHLCTPSWCVWALQDHYALCGEK